MLQLSSRDLRMDYDFAKFMIVQANFAPRDPATGKVIRELTREETMKYMNEVNDEEITQGYIETAANLSPLTQVIKFTIIDTQQIQGSPVVPLMKLLTMQDSFLCSTMSYFLRVYSYTGGNQQNVDFTGPTDWSPVTFVDTWKGGGVNAAFDPGCGMFWFGSNISITVNKKVLIPALDCYRFYKAPDQQSTTGIYVPNWLQTFKPAHDGSVDGYYPVVPYVVIGGGRDNDVRLNLPANIPPGIRPFINTGWNETFQVQACLSFRGIQMQNSTNVK